MITLDRLEFKLDMLREDMDKLLQSHAALDAKLKEVDAGLHETAMRNHQQIRHDLAELYDKPKPKRKKVRR